MNCFKVFGVFWLLTCMSLPAQDKGTSPSFPPYMRNGFDYATFTQFDASTPPKSFIYQSNGFMALQEHDFGGQTIFIPVAGPTVPSNRSERISALKIDAPVFTDRSGRIFKLRDSPAKRSLTYFADRTVYRARFENGPQVTLTVYPVYGKPIAVIRVKIEKANGPVGVSLQSHGDVFQNLAEDSPELASYGSTSWPYRLLIAATQKATVHKGRFQWKLAMGGDAALMIALGGEEKEAKASLSELQSSPDLFDRATHQSWNAYLASAPLVAPAEPVRFVVGTTGEKESIAPNELVRSELWAWRGVLNTTCQVNYLPACPMVIADWNVFFGMWSNDGIAEVLALMATDQKELARHSILSWFRYAVNSRGDGTLPWTIFPSGKNTFQATGPERNTQGVPVQGTLLGEYIRLTGDKSILNETISDQPGAPTVWQALLAYQQSLLKVRDANHDHLIDWLHTYETGWDDKASPFIDLKGEPTSSINEQVFNLWSLQEMAYLARLQGEDPTPWEQEFSIARDAVHNKLWDAATQRYWDLDVRTGKLWTQSENLDAYYLLYYEKDPARIEAMMRRLNDPAKFNGPMLPTLAFDTPKWGGYWRGPSWPRIYGYVAMGLTRSGHGKEGFDWLSRAISANLGPLLPETVDPKLYPPGEHANGDVRIMGYDTLDDMMFPDVAGLQTWGGEDLTVVSNPALGRVFVRGQRWMGDRYDALFEPGHPTQLWRNGRAMKPLPSNQVWQAHKQGQNVTFEPVK